MSEVQPPTPIGERATTLKMAVNTVQRSADENGQVNQEEITLSAVYSDTGVNKQWSQWTPSGQLRFTVSNKNVFGRILPGQFYMVEMTRCEKDAI